MLERQTIRIRPVEPPKLFDKLQTAATIRFSNSVYGSPVSEPNTTSTVCKELLQNLQGCLAPLTV